VCGVLFGILCSLIGSFLYGFAHGNTPSLAWWVIGAEWTLRTLPFGCLAGAVFGNLIYQASARRLENPKDA
jgi:hypothetical protein